MAAMIGGAIAFPIMIRSGELIAMADARSWFTYYYWNDDQPGARLRAHRRDTSQARIRSRSNSFLDPSIAAPAQSANACFC